MSEKADEITKVISSTPKNFQRAETTLKWAADLIGHYKDNQEAHTVFLCWECRAGYSLVDTIYGVEELT